jgi:hypothetical protein
MRRVVAVAAIVAGLGLIAVPFATSLFDRTRGAERTFDAMRGTVSESGIAVARRDFGVVTAAGDELLNVVVPALARRLDMTPQEFQALLASDFPKIARAAEKIPGYIAFVGPTIDALDANREEFEGAQSLPGASLPITASPWLLILLGGGLVAAGAFAWRRSILPVAVGAGPPGGATSPAAASRSRAPTQRSRSCRSSTGSSRRRAGRSCPRSRAGSACRRRRSTRRSRATSPPRGASSTAGPGSPPDRRASSWPPSSRRRWTTSPPRTRHRCSSCPGS